MGQSYFIWNGIDCRSMGVWLKGPVPLIRPEERVKHVQIPGMSGDLTQVEGDDIYNSYIQTASLLVKGGFRVRDVYRWLRGAGYVTFSGDYDKRQKARIIGAITLNKNSHNHDWWVGECQFYCQPLKELLIDNPVTISTSATELRNYGDVTCKPLYKVTMHSANTNFTLTAAWNRDGSSLVRELSVSGLSANYPAVYVDCESQEIYNANGALITNKSSGAFPVLGPGSNTIVFSHVNKVEITKRERFL
jgi:phage-related protein